ncbi:hypothetical protein TVAG_021170 [Trichomonas vaginalis G3]|uniref:Elongation factor 1 beta central acidic region eukaryote domain-containing protein n=1 Tax=Trichomonas vaginalis (strain ATCC PRA-98 / G3) TaxID=412133 RepID=A2DH99_TRIV3|nr:hypothetical protein TVAG_021170 [Trichomonas vaginalis G3]|eukprot:XP_001581158.1 hypothetical protein [Trichomonas vaginalis G3]
MFTPKKYSEDDIFACYRTRVVYLNEFDFGPLYTEEPFLASLVELTRHPDLQAKIKTGSNRKKLSEGKDRHAIDTAIMRKEKLDLQEKLKKEETASVTSKSDSKQSEKFASSEDENKSSDKFKGKSASQSSLQIIDDQEANNQPIDEGNKTSNTTQDKYSSAYYPNIRVEKVQKYKPVPISHDDVINEQKFDEKGNLKYTIKTYKLGTSLQREQKTLIPTMQQKKPEKIQEKIQEIIPPKPRPKIDMTKDSLMPDFVPTRLVDSISSLTPDTRIMVNDPFEGIHMPKRTNRAPLSIFMPKKNLPPSAARNNLINNNNQEEIEVQKPQQKPIKAEKKGPENNRPATLVVHNKETNKIQIINNPKVQEQKPEKKLTHQQLKQQIVKTQTKTINNATKNVQKQKSSEQETIPEPDSIKESIKEPESIKESIKEPESIKESLKEPESIKESIKEPESVKEPEPEPEPVRILEIEPDPDLVNNGKKSGKKKKMSAAQKKLLKKLQRKNQTKEFEEEEEYNPYEAPRPFIPDIPDEMRSETEIRSNPPAPPNIEPIVETYKPLIQQLQDDDQISEQFLEQDEQINNNINYQEQKEEPINVSDHYKEPEEQKQISQPEIIENNAEYTEIPTKKVQTKILNNSQFIIPQQPAPESVPTVQQRSVITLRKVIKLKKVYRGDQVIDVKQEVISSIPANVAKTKLLSKSETEKRRQEQLQELKKLYDQTTTVAPVITTNETEEIPKKQEDINQLLTDRKSKRSKPSPPRQQQPKQQQQQYVWNDFTYDQNDENDEENEEDDLDLDNLDLPMMAALQNHQQNKAKTEKKKAEMAAKGVERFDEVDIAGMHLTFAPRKADHSVYYGVDIRNLGPDFTPSNIKITKPLKLHGPDIEHILESRKEKLASIMIPKEYLKDRTDTPEIASLKREIRKKLREAALEQRTYKSAWDINADFVREMGRSKEVDHKQINNLKYTAYPQGFGYTPPQEKQNNAGENQTESWEDYDFGWGTKVQGNFGSFDKIMENERLNPTDKIKVVQQTDTSILDELDFGPKPHVERKVAIKILGPAVDPEEQKIQERRKEFKIVPKRAEYKQRMEEAERNKPDTTMFNNLMAEEAENAKKKQSKIRYSPEKTRPSEFDLLMQDEANKTQSKVSTLRPKQKTIWDSVTVQADPVEKTEEEVPGGKTWGLTFKPKPAEKQKAPLRPSLRDDGDDYYGQTRKSFFESLMEEEKAKADAEKAARKSRTQQTKGVLMGRNDFNSLLQEEERKANEPEEETIVDLNETEHIPPNPMNNAPKLIENDEMFWGVEEQYDTNLIGEEAKQQNDQKFSDQKQSVSEVFEEPKQIASEKEEKPSRRERKRRGKSKESPKNEPQNIPAPKQQQQSSSGWDSLSAFQESDPMAGVTNLKYTRLTKAQRAKLNAESVLKTVAFRSKSLAARSSYRAPDYLPDGKEMPVLYEPSNQTWGTLEIDIPEEERIKAMKEKNRLMKVVKIDDDDVTEWGTKRKHNPIDFNLIEKTEIDQSSAKRRARSSNHVTFVGEVTFEPEKKKPKFVAPTIDEIATELPKLEEEEVNVEKWVNGVLGEDKTKEKEEDKKKYPIEEFSKQKRSASAAPSSAFDDPSNWGAAGNEDEMVFVGLTYKPKKFYDIREIQKQEEEKKKQMYHKIKRSKNKQAVDTSALDFSPSTKNRSQYEAPTVDSDFDEPEPYVEKAPERIQAFPEEIEKPIEKFEKPVEKFEKPIEKRPQKQTEKVPEKIEKPIENPYPLQKEESIDLDEIDLSDEEQLIKAALNYKPKPVEKKKKKVDLPTPSKWMSFDFDSLLAEPDEKKRSQSVQPVSTKQRIAALKANQNQPEFQPKQTKSKYEAPSILAEEEPKQEEFDDSWYEINDPHHVPFSGPRNKQQEKKEQQFDQILKEEKTKKEEATNLSFKPKETKSKYEAPDVVSDEEIKPKKKSTPVYRKFSDEDEDKEQKQEEKEKDEWDNVDNEFGEDLEVDGLKYEPKKQEKKESEFDKILKEEKTKHEEATNLSFKPKEKASKYEAPEVISDEEKEILPKRKPEFRKFSDDESEEDNKEQKKEEVNEWDNAKDGFTEELEIDGLKYEPKKQEKKESEFDKLLQEEKTKHEEATNLSFKPKEKASKYEAPEVISDEEKEILPRRKPEFRKFSDDESEEEKEEEKPQPEKSEWEAANDGFTEDLEVDGLKYEPKKQEKKESEFDKIMKEEKAKHEEATNVSFKPKEKSSKYEAPEVVPERKFGPKKKSTPIYRKFSDEDEEEEQKQQEIKEEKEKDEWDNVDNEFGEDLEVDGLKYEPKKKEKKPSEFELILLDEQTKKDDQIRVKRSRSPAKTAELPSFKPKETASKYEAPEIVSDQEKIQSSKGSIVSDHKTTETDEWNHVNDEFGEELEFSGMKYEPKKKEEEKKPEEFEKLLEEEKQKRFESVSEEFVQEEQPKKSKRSRSPTKAAVELPSFKPKETSTKYDAPEVVSDQEKQKSEDEVDVEKWVNNVLGSEKETEKDKEGTTPVSTEEEKPKDEWEAAAGDNFDEDIDIYGLKYEPKQKKQGTEFNKLIEEEKQKKEVKVEEQKPETEESPKKAKRARSPAKATELPTFKPKETSAKFGAPEIVSDQEKPEQIPNEEIKEEIKEEEPIPVVAEEEKPKDEWEAAAEDNFDEDIDIYGLKYEPKPKPKKEKANFEKLLEEEKQKKEVKVVEQKPVSQEIVKEESPKKARRARSPAKATELPSFKPKETSTKYDAPEVVSDQEKQKSEDEVDVEKWVNNVLDSEKETEKDKEGTTPVSTEEEKPKDEWEAAAGDNFDEDIDIYGLKYEHKQKPKKDKAEFNKLIEEEKQKEEESPKKVKRGRSPAKMVEKPEFKPKEKESKIEAPEATEEQIRTKAPEEEEEEEIDLNDVLELQNQVVSNDDWDNLDNFIEDDIEIEGLKYQPKKKEQKKQEFNKLIEEEKAHSGQTEAVLENTTFKPKEKKSKSEAPSIDQVKKEKKSPQIKDFNEIQPEEEEKVEQTVKEEVVDEWNNNETFTEEMEIDGLKYEPKQKSKKVEMKHSDEFNKLIEEENKAEKLKEQQLKPAFTPKSKQHKYDAPEIVNDQKESKKPVYKDFVSDEEQKQEDQKEIKEEKVKDEWEDIHEEFQEENYPIDGLKYVPKTTKISPENIVPSDEPKISDFDRIMMQEEKKRSSSPQPVSFQKKKQQQTKVTIDLPSFKPSTTKKSNYEAPEVTDEQIKVEEKGKPVQKEEIEVVEEKQVDEWNETTFDEGMDYDGLKYIPKQQHSVEKPSKQKTEVKFTEKPKQQQKEQKKEFNAWNAAAGEFAGDEEEKKESNYVVKPIDIKPKQIRSTSPSARQGKKLFEELLDEEKKLHEKELEEKQKKQKEMKQKAEIHPRFTEDFDEFPEEEESSRAKIPIDISKIVKSPTYLSQKKTIIKDLFPPGFEPGSFEQELPPGYEEQTKPIQPEQIINKEQPKKEEKVKPLQPEQIVATEKKEKEQPTKKEEVQPKKAEKVPQKPVEKVVKEQPTKKEEIKPVKTEKVSPKPVKEEVKPKEQPIKKAKEEVKQEKVIKEQPKKEEKPISSDLSKLQKFIIKNEKIIDNESKEKKKRSVSPPPFAVRAKPTKKKVIKTKEILQELQTITKKKQTKPEKKKEEPKLPEKVPEEDVHAKVPLPLKSLPDDFDLLISSDQSSNMLISDSDLELPDNLFGNDSQLFKESSGSDDKFSDGPMFESSDELPMTLLDNVQQIKKHESKDNIKEQEEEEKDDADNEDWTLENDDDMSPFEFEKKSSPEQKEKESSNSMEEEEIEVVETKKVPVLVQEEVEIVEESKLLANNVIERVKKSANKKRSSSPQPVSFQKTKKFLESKEIVVPLQQTKKQQNIPVEEQITFEEQPKTEIKPIEPSQFMTDESQVSEPPKQVEEEIVKTPLEEIKQSMKKLTEKPSKKQTKPSKTSQPSFKPKSQTKKMEEPEVQEEQIKPIEKPEKPVEKVPEKQTKNEEKPQKVTEKPIEKVTEKVEEKVEEKPKQSESAWNMDSDDWGAAEFAEDDIFFGTGLVYKPNPNSNKQENKAKTNKKSAYAKSKSSFDTLYDDEAYLEKSRKDKEEATRIRDIFDEVDQLTAKKPTKSSVEIPDIFLTKKDEIADKNKHGAVEVFDDSVDVINGFWGPIRVQPQTKTTFDIIDEEEKTKEEKVKINRQKQRSRSAAPTSLGFTPKKTTTYQPPEYVPPNEDKKEIKQKKSSIREMPDISPEELDEIMSVEIPERKDYKIERYDSWEAAENNIFNEEDDISIIGRKYTPIEIKLNPARSRSLSKSDTNEMKFTAPILGKFVTTTFNEIMTEEQKINSFNHSKYTQRSKSVMPTRRRKRDPTEPIPEVEFSPSHKSFIEAPTYESDQEQPPEPKPKEIKDKFLEEEQQPEPQITWKVDSWDDFKSDQFNEDEDLILMPTFYHPKPDAPKFQVAKRERKTQSKSKSEKPPRKLKSDAIEKADQVLRDHQNVIKLAEKQQQQTQTQTKTKPTESDIRVYDESAKSLGQDWGEKPKQTTTMNFDSLVAEENEKEKIKDAAIKVDFEPHTFVPKYEPPTYDETAPVLPPEEKSEEEKTIEIKYEEDSAEFDPMGVKAKVREYHDDIDNWKATDDILEDVMIGRQYTPRKNDEYIQQFWDETKRAKVQSQRAKSELPRANKRDKSKDKDKLVHVADPNIELKWHVDPTKVVNNMDTDFSKIMESEQIKAENEEKSEKAKMVIDLDEEQASEKVTKMIYRRKEKKEKYVPLNDEEIKEFEEAIKPINERATVSRISAQRKSRPVLEPFTESIEFTPEPIDPVTSTAPDYPYLAEDEENYKKEKIEEDKKQMDEKLGKLEAEHKKEEMKKEFLKSKFFEEFNEWENASKLIFVEDPPPGLVMQQFVSKFEEYKPINVSKKQQPDQPSPNRRQIRGPVKRGKVQVEEPEIELSFYDAPEEKEEPKSVVIKTPVLKIGGKNGPLQLPAKFLPPAVKIGRKKQVDQPAKENVSEKQTNVSAAHSVLDGIINPVPEPAQEQTEEPIIPVTKLDEPIIGPKVNLFSPQKFERTDLKPVEKSNSIEESKPVKELTVVKKNPTRKVKQQVQEPVPIVVKTEEKPNIEIPQEKQVVPKKPGVIGAPTISFDELMKREEKVAKGEEKEENIDIGWVQQQLPKSIPTVSVSKWVKPKRVQPQEEEKQRKPSPKKSQKKKQKNEENNQQKLRFKPIMPLPIKRKEPVTDTSTYTRPVPMVEPKATTTFFPATLKYINEDGKLVVENMFSVPQPPKKPSLSIRRTKAGTTEVETTVFTPKEEEKKEVEQEIKQPENVEQVEEEKNEVPTVELPEKEKLSVGKKPEEFDLKKWARNDELMHNEGVEEEEIPDVTKIVPEKPKEEENIPNFWLDEVSPEEVALVEKEEEERKKQQEMQQPKPEEIETSLPEGIKPVERPQTEEQIPTFEELEGKKPEEVSTPTEEAVEEKKPEETKVSEEEKKIEETISEVKPEEQKPTEEETVKEEKVEETIKPAEEEKKEEVSVAEKEEPTKVEEEKPKTEETVKPEEEKPVEEKKEEIKETPKTEEVKEEQKPTEEEKEEKKEEAVKPEESKKEEKKEEQGKEEEEYEYEYVYEEEDVPEKEEEKGPSPEELMENFRKEAFKRAEERKRIEAEEEKKREEERKIRRMQQLEKEREEAIKREEEKKRQKELEELREFEMANEERTISENEALAAELQKGPMTEERSRMLAFQRERMRRKQFKEEVMEEEAADRRKQKKRQEEEERRRVREERLKIKRMMEQQEREQMRASFSAVDRKVNALFNSKARVLEAEEKLKQQKEEKLTQQRAERDAQIKQRQAILQAELERRRLADFERFTPKNKKKQMMEQLAKAAEEQRLREIQEEEERRRKEEEEIRRSKMTEEEKRKEKELEEQKKREEKKLREEQRRRQYEEEQKRLQEEQRRKQEAILEEKRKAAEEMRRKFEEKMKEKEEEQRRAEEMRKKAEEVMEKIIENQDKQEAVIIDAHEEEIRRLQELADKKLEAKMRKRQRRQAKYGKRRNEDDTLFESTSSSDEEEEQAEEEKHETTEEQKKKENEEIPTWNTENEEKKDLKIIPAKYTEKKARNVIDIIDPTSQWTYDDLTEQETKNSQQSFFSRLLLEEESLLKAKQKQKSNEPKDEMAAKMGDFDEIETGTFTWQSAKKDPTRDELRNVFQRISAKNTRKKSPQKKGVGYMQRLSQSESRQILSKPNKDKVLVLSALLRANVADINWDEFVESIYGRSREDIVYALMSVTSKANAESITAKFIEKFK